MEAEVFTGGNWKNLDVNEARKNVKEQMKMHFSRKSMFLGMLRVCMLLLHMEFQVHRLLVPM